MEPSAVLSLAIAELAIAVAAAVVLTMWRRHRRHRRAARLRHPAAPPPLHVTRITDAGRNRFRIEMRADVPSATVDIVSYRARGTEGWNVVPIVHPVGIGPGGWALLPGSAPDDDELDVVVGWTLDHPDGPVTGSRTFPVSESGITPPDPYRRQSAATLATVPALVALALLVGGAVFVGTALWDEVNGATTSATPGG